ncbi:Perlucin-like 1, partial [Homarus americanus]
KETAYSEVMVRVVGLLPVVVVVGWWCSGDGADAQDNQVDELPTATESEMRAAVVINQMVIENMGQDAEFGGSVQVAALAQAMTQTFMKLQEVTDLMTQTFTILRGETEALFRRQPPQSGRAYINTAVQQDGFGAMQECPVPFFRLNSECFYVHAWFDLGWMAATNFCQRLGGDLAEPENIEVLVAALHQRQEVKKNFWLGASDLNIEHRWVWTSGASVDFQITAWKSNEPNDANGNEDCLLLVTDEYPFLNDVNCETKQPFICEQLLEI